MDFFESKNEKTTHFFIGINIHDNRKEFLTAFNAGHDIGVHTWSHPYMTNKSNEDIASEVSFFPPDLSQENQLRILTIY